MIEIVEISKKATDYNSFEEFYELYKTAIAESYEQYIEQGHSWCWSLVGNIVKEHEYSEEREYFGTKKRKNISPVRQTGAEYSAEKGRGGENNESYHSGDCRSRRQGKVDLCALFQAVSGRDEVGGGG